MQSVQNKGPTAMVGADLTGNPSSTSDNTSSFAASGAGAGGDVGGNVEGLSGAGVIKTKSGCGIGDQREDTADETSPTTATDVVVAAQTGDEAEDGAIATREILAPIVGVIGEQDAADEVQLTDETSGFAMDVVAEATARAIDELEDGFTATEETSPEEYNTAVYWDTEGMGAAQNGAAREGAMRAAGYSQTYLDGFFARD
ncbi:hypothetical protein EUX98_g7504 [Antrodiella citrinella]|uniref:Uncharacterized protein n=1 Tax=Antrodiella citrinella TaxID=2447956 RepID=A0A4V3XHU6_9APHY|nr:hypothetical protein EUX98_g7504 [Antrodiella citrinella]